MSQDGKTVDILLVEDNEGDANLAKEALAEAKVKNNIYWVEDGEEAIEFLRQEGKYDDAPRPDVILLDLNLPKKDGREVLADVKANDDWKRIPVVVLTASEAEADILKTYNLHANCYVTKPIDLEQFLKVVKAIEGFWFTIVRLPNGLQ